MDNQPQQHFYVTSIAEWAVTTDKRDLRQLLNDFHNAGYPYDLFLVPCAWNTPYGIRQYQPEVEGTQLIASFPKPKKRK